MIGLVCLLLRDHTCATAYVIPSVYRLAGADIIQCASSFIWEVAGLSDVKRTYVGATIWIVQVIGLSVGSMS